MHPETPRSEFVPSAAACSSTPGSAFAAPSITPSFPAPTAPIRKRKRAIDVVRRLTARTASSSAPSSATSATGSNELHRSIQQTSRSRLRACDVLRNLSSRHPQPLPVPIQSTSDDRPPARPRKRLRSRTPDIDLGMTTSDDEDRPAPSMFAEPEFIYNTNDLLATRQTIRGWNNSSDPSSWIRSREELHSDQVDLDRLLPEELDDFPSFAISAGDMQSLHNYLMARFDVETFEDYMQMVALFRNTQAIEAMNARQRLMELAEASKSIENAQYAVLDRLKERCTAS